MRPFYRAQKHVSALRVNDNGFPVEPAESSRTVFCNMKSVGYNEYFKSEQTGKVVERKCEVHLSLIHISLKLPCGRAHTWCRGCGVAQERKAG